MHHLLCVCWCIFQWIRELHFQRIRELRGCTFIVRTCFAVQFYGYALFGDFAGTNHYAALADVVWLDSLCAGRSFGDTLLGCMAGVVQDSSTIGMPMDPQLVASGSTPSDVLSFGGHQ
jgi:hypothetical protein